MTGTSYALPALMTHQALASHVGHANLCMFTAYVSSGLVVAVTSLLMIPPL